ncbi:MAG: GNAT family N-acetyltransferase [Geodermatophilaceae bacterium]|nr:GNAT family N-acetyltransferase [Geodermatophilaceae bacterium]
MAAHPGWPVTLCAGRVRLRPLRRGDAADWERLQLRNEAWLSPWEPTAPSSWAIRHSRGNFRRMVRALRRRANLGLCLPFAVLVDGKFAGQLTVDNVVRGVLRSAHLGYWIDRAVARQGHMSLAVALVIDHCFGPVGLHRLQADVRPENAPSRALVSGLGFREEAFYVRYLDIAGDWRDHVGYALTTEDARGGELAALEARRPPEGIP